MATHRRMRLSGAPTLPPGKSKGFFELLKDLFVALQYIPTSSRTAIDEFAILEPSSDGMIPILQIIYREHGWPNMERFCKKDCLADLQTALRERYLRYFD
jgi:hypothetical protein